MVQRVYPQSPLQSFSINLVPGPDPDTFIQSISDSLSGTLDDYRFIPPNNSGSTSWVIKAKRPYRYCSVSKRLMKLKMEMEILKKERDDRKLVLLRSQIYTHLLFGKFNSPKKNPHLNL
jgi:hypothetical protein